MFDRKKTVTEHPYIRSLSSYMGAKKKFCPSSLPMAWQDLNSFQHSGNSFADNQATSPIFVQLILESDPVWLTDSFIIAQKERKEEEKYVLMERNMSGRS